jgi:hypothetical protein
LEGHPILKGRLFFNHFAKLTEIMVLDNLSYFFIRGAAISCVHHQLGFDLVIPVCLENGKLTAIFVQIKNYNSDITGGTVEDLRVLMMLAAKSIFDPETYRIIKEEQKAQKKRKTSETASIAEIIAENNNETSLDNSSIYILMNLRQGAEGLSRVHVYASERYIEAQGISSNIYPSMWGVLPETKKGCLSIIQSLLASRTSYDLELKSKANNEYREHFLATDHDHRYSKMDDNAKLHDATLSSPTFLSTKPGLLGGVKVPKALTWTMMDDLYHRGLPHLGILVALKSLPNAEKQVFGKELADNCRKVADEIARLGSREAFASRYRKHLGNINNLLKHIQGGATTGSPADNLAVTLADKLAINSEGSPQVPGPNNP